MTDTYARYTIDLRLRNLRPQTIEKYTRCIRAFDAFDRHRPLHDRDRDDLRGWLLHLIDDRELATSTYLVHLAALRFLFTFTLGRPEVASSVPTPIRRAPATPRVPDQDEVMRLFDAAPNSIARLAFQTAYATGIRLGELCRILRADLRQGAITVRNGKGGLTRTVAAGARLPALVDQLAIPGRWLFPARVWPARQLAWADRPVAARTVSRWFRVASARAGVPDEVTFHGLRHAFASHLHERGVDLRTLQIALGHRGVAATERYLRGLEPCARIGTSPLDWLPRGRPDSRD